MQKQIGPAAPKRKFTAAAAALCLGLTGCAGLATLMGPPATTTVANSTVLDEQAAITVELAYKAARLAAEMAVDAGVLKGERAAQVAALDNKAFAAVTSVRAAYRAGNASYYGVALQEARAALETMITAIK